MGSDLLPRGRVRRYDIHGGRDVRAVTNLVFAAGLVSPSFALQGGAPLLFGGVLDNSGPLLALLLTGSLTGVSFLALFALSRSAPAY